MQEDECESRRQGFRPRWVGVAERIHSDSQGLRRLCCATVIYIDNIDRCCLATASTPLYLYPRVSLSRPPTDLYIETNSFLIINFIIQFTYCAVLCVAERTLHVFYYLINQITSYRDEKPCLFSSLHH